MFAPPSPFFTVRTCSVRETEIPVEQQPPQGVFVCDHAGLVINKLYLGVGPEAWQVAWQVDYSIDSLDSLPVTPAANDLMVKLACPLLPRCQ